MRLRGISRLRTGQLLHEPNDLLPDDLRRQHAYDLVADPAALVDYTGLGYAVHAVLDSNLPLASWTDTT